RVLRSCPTRRSSDLASPGGTIRNNLLGAGGASVATPWALAAGSALTGGIAPVTHRAADFASTGTAQASVGELKAIEYIDGDLVRSEEHTSELQSRGH